MIFYNLVTLIAGTFLLPKWLFQKKYRGTRLQKFGLWLPPGSNQTPSIWLHMVSVGETKAMISIYKALKKEYPNAAFYLSSVTTTGHLEAKKSLPGATSYFYLPLDLSWIMKKLIHRIKPDLLILSEGDFWLHMIEAVKNRGGKIVVLNGKISEKSAKLYAKFPYFSKKLFAPIDSFFVQNHEYAQRFSALNIHKEKISSIGNLKLSIPFPTLSKKEKQSWQKKFNLHPDEFVITLGSTHENEEELILRQIPNQKVLIAPRHPHRFAQVRKLLKKLNNPNFILVDQMGILPICYQLSNIAIVGGSFIPKVGGHNIFEPIQAKIPVLFGPYMHAQKDLTEIILKENAGIQTTLEKLPTFLIKASELVNNAQKLAQNTTSIETNTWQALKKHLP